ncbi:MAG: glycosyltransferase [Vicinamibacterales bacterium]
MIKTVVHFMDTRAVGGAERIALQMMTALDRRAWRPVLFHHDEPWLTPFVELTATHDIEHRVVPRIETVHDLAKLPRFWNTIRTEAPAVFHAHMTWPLSCKYGMLAAVLARVPAVVATAHTRYPLDDPFSSQPRLISRLVDRYMAVSEAVAGQLRDDFGIDTSKVEVVHNGIDVDSLRVPRSQALRQSLTGGRAVPVVMTVARLDAGKGHVDLLHAAALTPNAVFVFVGDGPLRGALETEARTAGVAERVLFLGQRDDVAALLACADAFVLPSLAEGLPLSVLEAMAAGVPVVATAFAGVEEVVQDDRTGVLAEPGNPASLARAMRRVLDDAALARDLVAAASRRLQDGHFTVNRMATAVTRLYDTVLAA